MARAGSAGLGRHPHPLILLSDFPSTCPPHRSDTGKFTGGNFLAYLNDFSLNVREAIDKFRFHSQIPTMIEANLGGSGISTGWGCSRTK